MKIYAFLFTHSFKSKRTLPHVNSAQKKFQLPILQILVGVQTYSKTSSFKCIYLVVYQIYMLLILQYEVYQIYMLLILQLTTYVTTYGSKNDKILKQIKIT